MKKLTAFLSAACLLFTAAFLTSCSDGRDILASTDREKVVVLTADGEDVPYEMYYYIAGMLKTSYEERYGADCFTGADSADYRSMFEDEVTATLKNMYATVSACRAYGIDPDEEGISYYVDYEMDKVYASYGGDYAAYKEAISEYCMNDAVYRFIVRNDVLAETLMARMTEKGDIERDPEKIREIFSGDGMVRVKNLLIKYTDTRTDAESKTLAESLKERLDGGEDFDTLLNRYGEDLFMFSNPDGYYVTRGNYHEEFEDAAFSLDIGEYSGVIETPAGYSIVMRCEKDEEYIDRHFDSLSESYAKGAYNVLLGGYAGKMDLKPTGDYAKYAMFQGS